MTQSTETPILHVKAYSMFSTLYEGPAQSLSGANSLGPFDILPGHANMLAILSDCTVRIVNSGQNKEFDVSRAILRVRDNTIDLLINNQ